MSTPAAEALKILIATVQPVLKELDFRRRGSTFNRTVAPDGLVHVISVQRGGYIHLQAADTFGLAPSHTAASPSTSASGCPVSGCRHSVRPMT